MKKILAPLQWSCRYLEGENFGCLGKLIITTNHVDDAAAKNRMIISYRDSPSGRVTKCWKVNCSPNILKGGQKNNHRRLYFKGCVFQNRPKMLPIFWDYCCMIICHQKLSKIAQMVTLPPTRPTLSCSKWSSNKVVTVHAWSSLVTRRRWTTG